MRDILTEEEDPSFYFDQYLAKRSENKSFVFFSNVALCVYLSCIIGEDLTRNSGKKCSSEFLFLSDM